MGNQVTIDEVDRSAASTPTVLRSVAKLPGIVSSSAQISGTLRSTGKLAPVVTATATVGLPGPVGPQGPAGPQGPPGVGVGPAFTFTQASPSAAWVVYHNLGRKPSVSVIRSDSVQTYGAVSYPNDQSLIIQFNAAISGVALCY